MQVLSQIKHSIVDKQKSEKKNIYIYFDQKGFIGSSDKRLERLMKIYCGRNTVVLVYFLAAIFCRFLFIDS